MGHAPRVSGSVRTPSSSTNSSAKLFFLERSGQPPTVLPVSPFSQRSSSSLTFGGPAGILGAGVPAAAVVPASGLRVPLIGSV